jgi:GDPmannose 4,6-dehydratase
MKKAIVVGSDGQDGTLIFDYLKDSRYRIIGIDRKKIRFHKTPGIKFVNIGDAGRVCDLIRYFKPDEIYYLAAFHSSSEEKALDVEMYKQSHYVNVLYFINFLEGVRKYSPKTKVFYAASSHIFGNPKIVPQNERTPIAPTSIYGITKAAGFFICRHYRENYSLFVSTGILYNHESCLRNDKFVSKKIIKGAIDIKNGRQNRLNLGDLSAEVDWGYAPDYVRAMRSIMNIDKADDFIIATGEKHTVLDFVKITFGLLKMDWKLYVKENKKIIRKDKKNLLIGDAGKLMRATGWKPSISFKDMIKIMLEAETKERMPDA